jgi:dethiobiotin synthetase
MRRSAMSLLVVACICGFGNPRIAGAEDAGQRRAKEAATRFAKAINAKRVDDLMIIAGVPWWSGDSMLTRDRDQLKKLLQRSLKGWSDRTFPTEVTEVISYSQARKKIQDEKTRQVLDKVLTKSDYVVVFGEYALLVRVRAGKAEVVGGAR